MREEWKGRGCWGGECCKMARLDGEEKRQQNGRLECRDKKGDVMVVLFLYVGRFIVKTLAVEEKLVDKQDGEQRGEERMEYYSVKVKCFLLNHSDVQLRSNTKHGYNKTSKKETKTERRER